jgi:endonuclease YncB( thermonuclease family)
LDCNLRKNNLGLRLHELRSAYMPRIMFFSLRSSAKPRRGGALLLAAAAFAAGLSAGALIAPVNAGPEPAAAVPAAKAGAGLAGTALRSGHPAQVLRVVDGDTFEARVRIWPGMDVTTRVRLLGIDTPELRARCEAERAQALAARDALARILAQGDIGVAEVGQDKYGGRVNASASTALTHDVAEAMIAGGFARRYSGGRRLSWCG